MVFMTMGDDDGPYFVPVFNQVTHVRDDEVDAEHVVIGKARPASMTIISFHYWMTVIFLPISPKPPKGNYHEFFFF